MAAAALVLMTLGALPLSVQDAKRLAEARGTQSLTMISTAEATPTANVAVDELTPYREQALPFAESHFPKDAQMLMAAGLLSDDKEGESETAGATGKAV